MSRRAVHNQKQSIAMGHGQQAIWDQIREQKNFTVTSLHLMVDMHRTSVRGYVKRLIGGGYVKKADDFETSFGYELIHDAGRQAPRLTRDGSKVIQGRGNANMWRTMRNMKEFSPKDLAAHATTSDTAVSERTAKAYCTALQKGGYLRIQKAAQPPYHQAVYRLVRDTGPKAPQIQKIKQVYDPNLDKVTYRPEVAS